MPIVRKLLALLLLMLMLFSASAAASAAPAATATHTTVRETVTWMLPADQCAGLPAGVSVSGAGERIAVTNTNVIADGSSQIVSNDLVKGVAVGSDGSTYRFVYHNHTAQDVPVAGGPIRVTMVDDFVLNGDGSAPDMSIGFNWRWTYTPPTASWPPADNWQRISTRGDSFTCDPI
jgi:hypothetical protein